MENETYFFYYDESGHTRVITEKSLVDNNFVLYFSSAIVGWNKNYEPIFFEKYKQFENKYKAVYSCSELKSTVIKTRKYTYGLYGFNDIDVDFINDYCDLILDEQVLVYLSLINKIHFLVAKIFAGSKNVLLLEQEATYSISKLLTLYRPTDVLHALFEKNAQLFLIKLKSFLSETYKNNIGNNLKIYENDAIRQLLLGLQKIKLPETFEFAYFVSFDGFNSFTNEMGISDYELFIDKEGTGKTLNAAKAVDINAKEINSVDSLGVQCADLLVGLFGKLTNGMVVSLQYKEKSESLQMKLLDEKWFDIDKKRFNLYKKIQKILIQKNPVWDKTFCSTYADHFLYLICYLNYLKYFHNYECFKRIDIKKHQEDLNQYMLQSMKNRFRDLGFKKGI